MADLFINAFENIVTSYTKFAYWFVSPLFEIGGLTIYPWSILTFSALAVIVVVFIAKFVFDW